MGDPNGVDDSVGTAAMAIAAVAIQVAVRRDAAKAATRRAASH
jgi:hypothetical protein